MYTLRPTPDPEVRYPNSGAACYPLATLADEHGGRAQIVTDDGCYVLLLRKPGYPVGYSPSDVYVTAHHWFPEAVDALVALKGDPSGALE